MTTLFVNARLADPLNGTLVAEDLLVVDGRVAARGLAARTHAAAGRAETIDLSGAILSPGLVDVHVHLREPGQGDKETIPTGTRAAAAGGFTSVACMPNTSPVLDEQARIAWVLERAKNASARVHPIAAITIGLLGERLADLAMLAEAGAVAFSDDGRPVANAGVMRRALEYAKDLGLPIVTHAEDLDLRGDGVMNEGATSARLGLPGIPAASETIAVQRDLELAALTGARLHVAHLSTAGSVRALRAAKARGLDVSGETAPHYVALTDEAVGTCDTNFKMNPPLRGEEDRAALIAGLKDGTIGMIATDHAPHTPFEKSGEFAAAPFGVIGLETSLAACWTHLVVTGRLDPLTLLTAMTLKPRALLGLPDPLAEGAEADLMAFDPEATWTVDPARFRSKARNTPFAGHTLTGRVLGTWLAGVRTFDALEEVRS
jgi:dihydroorotase